MSVRMGQLVWYDGGKGYLVPGTVVKSHPQGGVIVRSTEESEEVLVSLREVRIRSDDGENGIEDMTKMSDLHEGALIHNLRKRFKKKTIYTYVGSILIAVNPYEVYSIYGTDVVQQYEGQLIGKLPPHIFAVSSTSYVRMRSSGLNQCLIISGESGSGKTETTKLIIQYLASINKHSSNLISEQILEATPLLESFGNAKTVQNNNSSRFGKYLEIYFDAQGLITGARLSEFLLEKSRIVGLSRGERNYHVFYEMLAGLGPSERTKYGLTAAEDYLYLSQGKACTLLGKNDKEDFKRLCTAMEVLGILNEEQQAIFRILAAILHLGNIYYGASADVNGQEAAEIRSTPQLQSVANLLSGSIEKFTKSLTHKTTVTRGEAIVSPINVEQALDTRDALARALYARLFTWLVTRINEIVCKQERHGSIAVLDIFGFENFEVNGFEQLCINFANEQLQFYFNQHIFKIEQEEYIAEGLSWSTIDYQDNQLCLDLLCKRPSGIIQLLDDESNFPKGTDMSFLDKCHSEHSKHPHYVEPRPSALKFGIKHYAALVWYNVEMFLDKNRDILRSDLIDLLNSSKNKLISTLFTTEPASITTSRKRLLSVASKFSQSLSQLISTMSKCSPYFVRCIKPNPDKLPGYFNESLVMRQLRCLGVMETVHIRRLGFPIRVKFDSFLERYGCLGTRKMKKSGGKQEAEAVAVEILRQQLLLKSNEGGYQIGKTKLFLRESTERVLEEARAIRLRDAAVLIQKTVRGYLTRRRYKTQLMSAIIVQSHVRMFLARKHYFKLRSAIVCLQSLVRMKRQRRVFKKMLDERRVEEELKLSRVEQEPHPPPQSLPTGHVHHIPSRQVSAERIPVVSTLDLPADVGVILAGLVHTDEQMCADLSPVKGRTLDHEPPTRTLPANVDVCPFPKFAGAYFQEGLVFAMAKVPLPLSLLKLGTKDLEAEAVDMLKMVMNFMQESLTGTKDVILGNYIIAKALHSAPLRDELYTQICNQVWCNKDEQSLTRGWLLLALCSGTLPPSEVMDSYLLNFSFHYAYAGYKAYCQHNLLRTSCRHIARSAPPCLLEWRSARSFARTALEFHYPDGQSLYVPTDSWTTSRDVTRLMVHERGLALNLEGWTFQLMCTSQCVDLAGYGYLFDAISQLELPPEFPRGTSPHLVTSHLAKPDSRSSKVMSWFVESLFAPVLEPEESQKEEGGEERKGKGEEEKRKIKEKARKEEVVEEEEREVEQERKEEKAGNEDDDEDDLITDIDSMVSAIKSPPPPKSPSVSKVAALAKQLSLDCEDLLPPPPGFGGGGADKKAPTTGKVTPYIAQPPSFTGYHAELLQSALLVKQQSAQMEEDLSGYRGFWPQQSTNIGTPEVHDVTTPQSKGREATKADTEGRPPLRSQNSIGMLQKRHSRLSSLYHSTSSTGSGSLQADPVLDAPPPPPTINVFTVPPLWTPPITYTDPSWTLTLKKEFFNPLEAFEEDTVLDWVFCQVVRDTLYDGCLRMSEKERGAMQQLLKRYGVSESGGSVSQAAKVEVVARARELPCYFCCIFIALSRTELIECSHIGIGHKGVVFIKQQAASTPLLPVQQCCYDGIVRCVSGATSVTLTLLCDDKESSYDVYMHSDYANQIAELVSKQLMELETNRQYVMTLAEYSTFESTLLSFPKEAIIKLHSKANLERGWLFGEFEGRVGIFPEEYSIPLISWGESPSEKSIMRARLLSKSRLLPDNHVMKKMSSSKDKSCVVDGTKGLIEAIELMGGPLNHPLSLEDTPMREYASKHFLLGQNRVEMIKKLSTTQTGGLNFLTTIRDTLSRKKKEQAEGNLSELLRFSKSPIPVSLLQLEPTDLDIQNLAVECFLAVMRFMGDYVLKGTLEDNIFFILKCTREHMTLHDEVYCQLIKQLTDNRSTKPLSCLRGWQLLYICSAYFLCSASLLPSLVHFLQTCIANTSSPYHALASMCEFNLRRSLRFGGRKDPPSTAEIQSVIDEKYTRRQVVHLHDNCSKILRVKMSTATYDILKEMCTLLGFQQEEEIDEFGLYVDLGENCPPLPLLMSDYITDMTSMVESRGLEYRICFTKLVWNGPVKLQNSLYIDLLYFQAKTDVLNGFLIPLNGGLLSQEMVEVVCQLAALQSRAEGNKGGTEGGERGGGLTQREVTRLVPPSLSRFMLPSEWSKCVQLHYQSHVADLARPDARKKYIKLATTLPLYGSRFFPILATSDPTLQGRSLLAVNKKGLYFLDHVTKVVLQEFPYGTIVSTRMLRSQDGKQFFDIKLGSLLQQTILRCETPCGREIGPLLGKYINLWAEQQKELDEETYGIAHGLSYL